jgi:hypothetical protein
MATALFLCPHTGFRVQAWFSDDGAENGEDTYESVICLACRQQHLVNPKTGKVLGRSDE